MCYCAALTTIETKTRVVVLQHPRERDMPIGTARMASLCLPNLRLHVGVRWDGSAALREATSDPARPAILLYPAPGARDILRDPPAGPVTLVVVDGTWSQAQKVVRENPELASLPRYAFDAPEPSQYRIRREPCAEYVSTIESLMYVLGALEGDPARFAALREPMRTMIDNHLARQAVASSRRFRRVRPGVRGRDHMPREITDRPGDLVCVVGEANAWPLESTERSIGDELVHWVARRLVTGETFDVVAAPQHALSPGTPGHIEIEEGRLRGGVPRTALFAEFTRFLRPQDVVVTWGGYSTRLYRTSGGVLPDARLDARGVARRITRGPIGTVEAFAERNAPVAPGAAAALPAGRAHRRLDALVRIVQAWSGSPG